MLGSSCLGRHSYSGGDTSAAMPGEQSAVGVFMFSSREPPLGALPLSPVPTHGLDRGD